MSAPPRTQAPPRLYTSIRGRLLPIFIAGLFCYVVASVAGYSLWYFTYYRAQRASLEKRVTTEKAAVIPLVSPVEVNAPVPEPAGVPVAIVTTPNAVAPPGMVIVPGGEVVLGGGETKLPLRRMMVESFAIAETETTNEQYAEFIKETNHQTPERWINGTFPAGTADHPVTGVTWQDAADYCEWLSKKTGAQVRLPTEAEWELAARGRDNLPYPWGNEWKDDAAPSSETGGEVHAVRDYPQGRSPVGAFGMAGNVWEWTGDAAPGDEDSSSGVKVMLAKGGAANEPKAIINATSRQRVLATTKYPTLGFRYATTLRSASGNNQEAVVKESP
ncbi:MAG: SUMF1/EgtB/PvdO family nonheme iron enzyme [Pyrinomonadaceae bacterium]|nr:SUMF1/EgtB/PvdO family nonheme iron enzyme [Pyrinomonadaceae bacterium]